jgi:hypothetical protein
MRPARKDVDQPVAKLAWKSDACSGLTDQRIDDTRDLHRKCDPYSTNDGALKAKCSESHRHHSRGNRPRCRAGTDQEMEWTRMQHGARCQAPPLVVLCYQSVLLDAPLHQCVLEDEQVQHEDCHVDAYEYVGESQQAWLATRIAAADAFNELTPWLTCPEESSQPPTGWPTHLSKCMIAPAHSTQ